MITMERFVHREAGRVYVADVMGVKRAGNGGEHCAEGEGDYFGKIDIFAEQLSENLVFAQIVLNL